METKTKMQLLKLSDIAIGTSNPRKEFDAESINELAQSIKEKGVLQPILVRPQGAKFLLVCGERRYRASKIAEIAEIPVVIREMSDSEALELQIIENLQRKDVHPMEEAAGFKLIVDSKKYDVKELALRVGKSSNYVAARIKLAELIPELQKEFYKGRMSLKTAMALSRMRLEDQKDFHKSNKNNGGGEGTIEFAGWDMQRYTCNLMNAPFDTKDAGINPKMGACTTCQYNTASNNLFPEDADVAMCRFKKCFQEKSDVYFGKELSRAMANPISMFVSSNHTCDGSDKVVKKIQDAGFKVYAKSGYDLLQMPTIDKADWLEDNQVPDDYDTEEALQEAWADAVKDYEKEKAAYDKSIATGKYLCAFCAHGDEKGKYLYIKLRKQGTNGGGSIDAGAEEKAKSPAQVVQEKIKDGKATKEEIAGEIMRINDVEKRKQEIDEEKAAPRVYEIIEEDDEEKYQNNELPLNKHERIAAIITLHDKTGSNYVDDILENYGFKPKGPEPQLFNWLVKADSAVLTGILNVCMRHFIMDSINQGTGYASAAKHDDVAAWKEVSRSYFPDQVKAIEQEVAEERAARKDKIDVRIKGLKEAQKEAKPKKKK